MAAKVIFLDIDGPLIPKRQWIYSRRDAEILRVQEFDPIAVIMINNLLKYAPAKFVISSSWAESDAIEAFTNNGIDMTALHSDSRTPRTSASRAQQITDWLHAHLETTHWVAFDDALTPRYGGIKVSLDDGISLDNYFTASQLLQVNADLVWWGAQLKEKQP
jgi:hypothetical protein